MDHVMKFGEMEFAVPLAQQDIAAVLEANKVALPIMEPADHVRYALDHPIGTGTLDTIVHPGETVCVVIPDLTRRWQSPSVYLPVLIERLNACGIPDKDILILSATGTHRSHTEAERISLVGEHLYRRIQFADHDCTDTANLTLLGTTSRGTPVWINSQAMRCDRLILTGGVVYHFLAGFGGGCKAVLPGIAGYETIMRHHNLTLNPGFGNGSNPEVRSANLTTNPFQADLLEAAALAKPCYLLNVVVDDTFRIIRAFAGDAISAHREACALVDSIEGIHVSRRTPLVIASAGGFPKDMNLYQTSKTLSNALAVAEPGGTIIVLSRCTESFGEEECARLIRDFSSMDDRETTLRADFSIGGYVGFLFCESALKHHLIMVTDMPPDLFATTQIHAVPTLDAALELATRLNNGTLPLPVSLLPHGANTLPKLHA